jgi:hypothetical protein
MRVIVSTHPLESIKGHRSYDNCRTHLTGGTAWRSVRRYLGPMFKRFAVLLGLATMGMGLFLIVVEQSKNTACNANRGHLASYGMSTECIHTVWTYFGGFGLIIAGLIIVLIGFASMRKFADNKVSRHRAHPTEIQLWESAKRGRERPR